MKLERKRKKEQMPFAKNLSTLLKQNKVTIAQAAKACGVSPSTISDWSNGASPEDYLAVQKLAQFLGVSFSFILTGIDETKAVNENFEGYFEDSGDVFFDGYAQILIKKIIPRKKI